MSKTVRVVVLALGLLGLSACDSQGVGQRCQASSDCNTATDTCVDEFRRPERCPAGGANCICCPIDQAAAQAIAACMPVSTIRDAGSDVASD